MNKKCLNVAIVTFPIGDSGFTPLSNLVSIMRPLSGDIHLITGNTGYAFFKESSQIHTYEIKHKKGTNTLSRVIKYTSTQMKFVPLLMEIAQDVDFFIFFFGGESLLIPILTAKLLRKKVVLTLPASSVEISRARKDIFSRFLKVLEQINCVFSDRIVIGSERLVGEYDLEIHRKKILIAHEHFVDFNTFKVEKRLSERDDLVGYIGRLSAEKGILNFVRAISKILEIRSNVRFLISGDGPLRGEIEEYLKKRNLNDKVKVIGWISHENIPKYLNELKLMVVPSYTESGPLIAFEAMACGTLVLGSQVGMMSEILREGKNGFVLENNSAESIAENVLKIFTREDLNEISWNARITVEKKFTYNSAVKGYKSIIRDLFR